MKKVLLSVLCSVLLLCPALGDDASAEFTQVIAEGVGTSEPESLKDAFRNAIQTAVGQVIDAETLIKNDDLINDQILTYSDGFIKEHKVVSTKKDGHLIRTKILATVKRRSLTQKLESAKIITKKADGGSLFGEIVTQLEGKENAAKLLANAMKGFPLNCMTVDVVEQNGKPISIVGEPKNGKATIQVQLKVQADFKAYDAFAKRLCNTLDGIKIKSTEVDFKGERARGQKLGYTFPENFTKSKSQDPTAQRLIFVNTHRTNSLDKISWKAYTVDKSCFPVLGILAGTTIGIKLELMDNNGDIVTVERFSTASSNFTGFSFVGITYKNSRFILEKIRKPQNGICNECVQYFLQGEDGNESAVISPFFFAYSQNRETAMYDPFTPYTIDLSLTLDELKKINNVKVSLYCDDELPPADPEKWLQGNKIRY